MNDHGADVLMAAALEGVPQLRNQSFDGNGGFCAIALLLHAAGCRHLHHRVTDPDWFYQEANKSEHNQCMNRMSYLFQIGFDEWTAIQHESNSLGHDFLTLAWQHCPNYGVKTAETSGDDD